MSFFLFSCIITVFFSLIEIFLLQYCFRHCAFCNLDWGITIYHHFKLKKDIKIDTPFPNEISSFGCTLMCRLLLMLRNTTDVFQKTMNFNVRQMVDRSMMAFCNIHCPRKSSRFIVIPTTSVNVLWDAIVPLSATPTLIDRPFA
jgi:hypothetical protein